MKFNEANFQTFMRYTINKLEKFYSGRILKFLVPEALNQLKSAKKNLEEDVKIQEERKDLQRRNFGKRGLN